MCGIYGWHLSKKHTMSVAQREAMAASLAASNTSRGGMSWGTYSILRGADGKLGEPQIKRAVGPLDEVPGIGLTGLADVMMGHTRYATRGAITVDNCHPFKVGDVTLAHNGVVYNWASLDVKYGRSCAVDSQHLAHHLAERRPFTDLEGYGAIQYVRDAAPGEVQLSRMAGGQLAICGLGSKAAPWGAAWSSDERHLHDALRGAGINFYPYEAPKVGRVYTASDDGVLYLLPAETLRHDLAEDRRSEREAAYSKWLTSGALGDKPSPGRSLSKSERRRERRAREAALRGPGGGSTSASGGAAGGGSTGTGASTSLPLIAKPGQLALRDLVEDPEDDDPTGRLAADREDFDLWLAQRARLITSH